MTHSRRSTPRVHEYFVRGYHRSRDLLPPGKGEVVRGIERQLAQFFLGVYDDYIESASYNCSTCVVLVAYCEYLAEAVKGLSLTEAGRISAPVLIRAFPEVPHHRHDRAFLAVEALHSAVRVAKSDLAEDP